MASAQDRPLPEDEISDALRALRGELASRLRGVATVTSEAAESRGVVEGCTVEPAVDSAVSVWWMHSAEDIVAGLANAPGWELPRTREGVESLRSIVEAAIRGEVEVGTGRGLTTYRIRTKDGVVR